MSALASAGSIHKHMQQCWSCSACTKPYRSSRSAVRSGACSQTCLPDSVAFAEAQYLVALYVLLQRSCSSTTLQLAELDSLLHSLFPAAADSDICELMQAFQAQGKVWICHGT